MRIAFHMLLYCRLGERGVNECLRIQAMTARGHHSSTARAALHRTRWRRALAQTPNTNSDANQSDQDGKHRMHTRARTRPSCRYASPATPCMQRASDRANEPGATAHPLAASEALLSALHSAHSRLRRTRSRTNPEDRNAQGIVLGRCERKRAEASARAAGTATARALHALRCIARSPPARKNQNPDPESRMRMTSPRPLLETKWLR